MVRTRPANDKDRASGMTLDEDDRVVTTVVDTDAYPERPYAEAVRKEQRELLEAIAPEQWERARAKPAKSERREDGFGPENGGRGPVPLTKAAEAAPVEPVAEPVPAPGTPADDAAQAAEKAKGKGDPKP